MVSFERVFEVLDAPEAIQDKPGAVDLVSPTGLVEFKDVWFRYPAAADVTVRSLEAPTALAGTDPDRDVLQGVSLTLQQGVLAVVGRSRYTLAMLGLCAEDCRLPITSCADAARPVILEAMHEAGLV